MNQLNSLIIEGNLVKDSVLSEPTPGFKVCKFTIGVNRWYKNAEDVGVEEVSYFDVEAYRGLAEYCSKKTEKGRGVRVVGRLKQNLWKDTNGKTHSNVFVIAEHIEFKPSFAKSTDSVIIGPSKSDAEAKTASTAVEEVEAEEPVMEKQAAGAETVF